MTHQDTPGDLLLRQVRVVQVPGWGPPGPVDVLIRAGRIAQIADRLPDAGVRQVAGAGRWLIPGLWDEHVHLRQWSRTLGWLDLSGTGSPDQVIDRVAAALATSQAPVLVGFGYRTGAWTQVPLVADLDRVSRGRPVVLISGDAHNGWLNSPALALLGLGPRDTVLDEYDWFPVFPRLEQLPRDPAADAAAYADAVAGAAARGIVGITDLEFGRGFAEWPQRFADGVRSLRVRAATYPEDLEEAIAAGLRTADPLVADDPVGRLTMGPVKIITDGSLNTRTAYCHSPYADDPSCRGKLNVPPEELIRLLHRAHRNGLTAAVHAIGDAAVGLALDAFAATGARGTIEHAQLVSPDDVARMASLGVGASVQPAHLLDDRDVTAVLWPDAADRCFPLRSMLEAGVHLGLGSDAPVAPLDPWLAMAAAVHRSGDDRPPWNPGEALTAAQALAASTHGAVGIRPGAPADLVLLDADPLAPMPDSAAVAAHLRGIRVELTLLAGMVTHDGCVAPS